MKIKLEFQNKEKMYNNLNYFLKKVVLISRYHSLYIHSLSQTHVGELRSYCTVCSKKSKKIKVNMKEIEVVHSIELHLLYINRVFSQLSSFSFRKKSSFFRKMRVFQDFVTQ